MDLLLHYDTVTALAVHGDPDVAVELIASVEAVLAAMLTRSHSNSHSL